MTKRVWTPVLGPHSLEAVVVFDAVALEALSQARSAVDKLAAAYPWLLSVVCLIQLTVYSLHPDALMEAVSQEQAILMGKGIAFVLPDGDWLHAGRIGEGFLAPAVKVMPEGVVVPYDAQPPTSHQTDLIPWRVIMDGP